MGTITYIVVRIGTDVKVIFEDEFINGNEYRTQNEIIEVLKLLYNESYFDVTLHSKTFEEEER